MNICRFDYNKVLERWAIVDGYGDEVQELHCGDVLEVRPYDDDSAPWVPVRIELDCDGWWYMVGPDGEQRDDFELLDVMI